MPNFNLVVLAGNITRDPEERFTPRGVSVVEFGIAYNHRYRTDDGQERDEPNFFDCVAFGGTAKIITEYTSKGSPILIEGRIKQETWSDKVTGQTRSRVKVIVNRVQFLGTATNDSKPRASSKFDEMRSAAGPVAAAKEEQPGLPADDDIPF